MKKLIYLTLFSFLTTIIYSQNNMWVNDPQNWNGGEGAIENLIIDVQPVGLYAEVSYTFDLRTTAYFDPETQLEWVFEFNMQNPDIVFNDSWLWIEDYISKGVIYDKAEGVAIYEGIVNRRQDPSILTKQSDTRYILKVYPLFPDSSRKVKLSYLVPMKMENGVSSFDITTDIFTASSIWVEEAELNIKDNQNWAHNQPAIDIEEVNASPVGESSYIVHDFKALNGIQLTYESKSLNEEFFFGTYEGNSESFFELSFPTSLEDKRPPSYHLIAIDYLNNQAHTPFDQVLNEIESNLKSNLRDKDFVNFVYSDFGIQYYAEDYIQATDENLELAIDKIRKETDNLGFLIEAISSGTKFIQNKEHDANLSIISASNSLGSQEATFEIVNSMRDLLNKSEVNVTLNILDISIYRNSYWINNVSYFGNDYLYTQLDRLTDGQYLLSHNNTMGESLDLMTSGSLLRVGEYDLDIEPKDGFAYATYFISQGSHSISTNDGISIVGKYYGAYPFNVEFKGIYDGQFFDQTFTIEEDEAIDLDGYAKKIWTSNYILDQEDNRSTQVRKEIINASMEERLLSTLTTFLCLETDSIPVVAVEDGGGGPQDDTVSATHVDAQALGIKLYPNPFSNALTIEVPTSFVKTLTVDGIRIYNAIGELIETSTLKFSTADNIQYVKWVPGDELLPGMYLVQFQNGEESVSVKVIFVK